MPQGGKHSRAPNHNKPSARTAGIASKLSCRAQNDEIWELYKDDIRRIYFVQGKTLRETMQIVQITASERKWKEKLKEWGFQKNRPSREMAILISKRDKRLRDEGKDTIFFQNGAEIRGGRLENFKKRKTTKIVQPVSPSASEFPNTTHNFY
jgi:hypothetical protein